MREARTAGSIASSETLFASQTNKPCLSQCEGRLRRCPTSFSSPPDLARWKQTDYRRLARYRAATAADRAFDAEVGIEPPPAPAAQPWWQRALVSWGIRSPFGYKALRWLANTTASMNDPERNPATASFGKALRDGLAGFAYGVHATGVLTLQTASSLLKGDREGVRRYGGALLKGVIQGWIWGSIRTVGQLAWGTVKMATPIGLFETVPTWWHAIKDAWAGKRGGWDVALTSLFLMLNLIGLYGGVSSIKTANEFRTFQDTLPPAAQSQYISLSTAEQIRLFRAVRAADASPDAVDFYLEQIARPGSPLADLPLTDALRISSLAKDAIRNPQAEAVLIGRYYPNKPLSYEQLGNKLGFTYLDMEESAWNEFVSIAGKDAWWDLVNEPFMQQVGQSGKPVYVNVKPIRVTRGNLYAELKVLQDGFGYKVVGKEVIDGVTLWKMVPSK